MSKSWIPGSAFDGPGMTENFAFMRTPMRLTLFQRDDCRLCDQAIDVLAQARAPEFSSVFIDDDAELESRYGERVPVLRDEESGRELNWPFDATAVTRFLGP